MESTPVIQLFQKTIFPLILKYAPIAVALVIGWVVVSFVCFRRNEEETPKKRKSSGGQGTSGGGKNSGGNKKPSAPAGASGGAKAGGKKKTEKPVREGKQQFSHPWLLTSLKGHTGSVLDMDFSPNGKYLATCANDRAIFVWNTKDWKERDHKFIRYNVDYDHASLLRWSPDSKAFAYNRASDNTLEVCRLVKKPDGWIASLAKANTFPKVHKEETIAIGIAQSGKYMMSASIGTELVLWDLKGAELTKTDTYLMSNYQAKISPCSTFVAASGFAPDVKVWEVSFAKTGEFKQMARAFELTGHTSGVHDFDFTSDSGEIVTVSKDGSWRLYNIKVEYAKGESPHLIHSGKYEYIADSRSCIALSPDGQVIVIGSGPHLTIVNALTGQTDIIISHVYTGQVGKVAFDSGGEYILTAGMKHVHIFHNVTGYKARLEAARSKINQSGISQATKERLQATIIDSENFLSNFS